MKKNKFLLVISVLSFIFVLLGATFSFFTNFRGSKNGAVAANSIIVGANVSISALYNDYKLIPMNDSDILTAFSDEFKCVDINNYGACNAYNIDIENIGEEMDYHGTITFNIGGITNLNYMILDEDNNEYVPATRIVSGEPMTLGSSFILPKEGSRHFKLLIWLSNYDRDQNDEDAGGTYNASVTYESVNGYKITGSISNG